MKAFPIIFHPKASLSDPSRTSPDKSDRYAHMQLNFMKKNIDSVPLVGQGGGEGEEGGPGGYIILIHDFILLMNMIVFVNVRH